MIKDSHAVFKAVFSDFNKAIQALNGAPHVFHLTGSRCFGYESEGSDWDFFVGAPDNIRSFTQLRQWLTDNRFTRESNSDYVLQQQMCRPTSRPSLDDTLEVWIHQAAKIHIQIVRDAASKLEIQEAMKAVPGMQQMLRSLPKENRKAIWKMGRAIFDAGKTNEQRNCRRAGTG